MTHTRSLSVALALGLFISCGTSVESIETAPRTAHPEIDLGDASLAWGEPVEVENLKLWPIRRAADAEAIERPEYLTLDEALETGVATVVETGSVQQLELVNDSDRPILLLAGEVLQGGKQDRIIAHDTEVKPGSREPLASFCVEQGRWHAADGDASGGKNFASAKLMASNSVRSAAQLSNSQSLVWSNVAFSNNANVVTSPTGAYLATGADSKIQEQVTQRAARLIEFLEQCPDAVGFVAAVDPGEESEQVAAEIFGDARLFRAYREKLVRSYCLDSITRANARRNGVPIPLNAPISQRFEPSTQLVDLNGFGGSPQSLLRPPLTVGECTVEGPEAAVLQLEGRVEASTPELEHLHRTIYLTQSSEEPER